MISSKSLYRYSAAGDSFEVLFTDFLQVSAITQLLSQRCKFIGIRTTYAVSCVVLLKAHIVHINFFIFVQNESGVYSALNVTVLYCFQQYSYFWGMQWCRAYNVRIFFALYTNILFIKLPRKFKCALQKKRSMNRFQQL